MKLRLAVAVALAIPLVFAPEATAAAEIRVCSACEHRTVQDALAAAPPGATVTVLPGRYAGPLHIRKRVRLVGAGRPLIDGRGRGTVVHISAPGSRFEGFDVRSSGNVLDREDSGIVASGRGIVVTRNRISDVLFGVYLKDAPGGVLSDNSIEGMPLPMGRRGDGIRVWRSDGASLVRNTVTGARDSLIWFSSGVRITGNRFRDSRYGLHVMYSNDCAVTGNVMERNVVGGYFMYSAGLDLSGNLIRHNTGSAGFGLGLRSVDDVDARANLIADNKVGVFATESPQTAGATNRFEENVLAHNGAGVAFDSGVRGNVFTRNSFLDNVRQVNAIGGASLDEAAWSAGSRGNYWSDYGGYDADGDGVGDAAHKPQRRFERLSDARPELDLFLLSPAASAVDWAAAAFPIFAAQTELADPHPLVRPVIARALPVPAVSAAALGATGAGLLVLAALGVVVLRGRGANRPGPRRPPAGVAAPALTEADAPVLELSGLVKRFGETVAVDGLDLTVRRGEAVALWGPNGAGKTTIVRCILGLLQHDGDVRICGVDARREPKAALRRLGHVAQEAAFHTDLTVTETLTFYARFKPTAPERVADLLILLDLGPHAGKRVGALSGGMRRKLALAVALLGDPPILLLDEPMANLDEQSRDEVRDALLRLKEEGTALVLATHHADEVAMLADRVLLLSSGVLVGEVGGPGFSVAGSRAAPDAVLARRGGTA